MSGPLEQPDEEEIIEMPIAGFSFCDPQAWLTPEESRLFLATHCEDLIAETSVRVMLAEHQAEARRKPRSTKLTNEQIERKKKASRLLSAFADATSPNVTQFLLYRLATERWKHAGRPADLTHRWVHCSPELLHAGVCCSSTQRRTCACAHGGAHDHLVSNELADILDPAFPALKKMVHEALDNAFDNGHDFRSADPEAVAADVCSFDADLESKEPAELLPHIRTWQILKTDVPS
jgi:hypothetical protein